MPNRQVKIGLDSYILALKRDNSIEISEKTETGGLRILKINYSLAMQLVKQRPIEFGQGIKAKLDEAEATRDSRFIYQSWNKL